MASKIDETKKKKKVEDDGIPEMYLKMKSIVLSNGIEKSDNDDRTYHRIVLKNKLEVLLISDPDTDKSAAALDVHVGHFSDPDDFPGLAHFLEHMLFLGTKKYYSSFWRSWLRIRKGKSC